MVVHKTEYENAPVILSILQIRFKRIEDFDVELISKLAKSIAKDYPIVNKGITKKIAIHENENETNFSFEGNTIDQVTIVSKDRKKGFIIERDRFNYQTNEKYKGLDELRDLFVNFWNVFSEAFKIEKLVRISLRHVNKFKLPLDIKNLNDYFTTYLNDNKNDHKISNLQFKFTKQDSDKGLLMHIGHSMENPIADHIPYIYDIDTIHLGDIKNQEKIILEIFDMIRNEKNLIFDSGLTDKAKKLIQ